MIKKVLFLFDNRCYQKGNNAPRVIELFDNWEDWRSCHLWILCHLDSNLTSPFNQRIVGQVYFERPIISVNKISKISVKLLQMRTEFGRNGLNFLAAKEFNDLPLQARKIESRLLFYSFWIAFLIIVNFVIIYSVSKSYLFVRFNSLSFIWSLLL